jgi:hypothetical protein
MMPYVAVSLSRGRLNLTIPYEMGCQAGDSGSPCLLHGNAKENPMLSAEHCIGRAERLRLALLTTTDPKGAARLRRCIEKYWGFGAGAKQQATLSQALDESAQESKELQGRDVQT